MPIRAPPGALPAAFRVHCLRVVRAFSRGEKPSDFGFNKASSSKCAYCTKGNEKCHPIPEYCSNEYRLFVNALTAWQAATDDAEKEAIFGVLKAEAKQVSDVVRVTRAGQSGLSVLDLLLVNTSRLDSLESDVKEVRQSINQLSKRSMASASAAPVAAAVPQLPRRRKQNVAQTVQYSDEDSETD